MPVLAAGSVSWVWGLLGVLTIPLLVGLNAFFVAAEFALVAVRRTRVQELMNQGVLGAYAVDDCLENLDSSIAATQLGITLASLGLGWAGEPGAAALIEPVFQAILPETWATVAAHTLASVIAFGSITFLHVLFGELVPKTVALETPDNTALWVAPGLIAFQRISLPFVWVINVSGNFLLARMGFEPAGGEDMLHSVEELQLLIEDSEQAGILRPQQAELVRKVFRLSGKRLRDCMIPRDKMTAIELHTPFEQILAVFRTDAHTRMPVYDGTLDNIVGIVNTKDVFKLYTEKDVVPLEEALYPPLFLKPEDNIAEALQLFRKERKFLAIVRDIEGQTLGLITMEDLIEEIVGDIEDEQDRPLPKLKLRRRGRP
jgi:CBS domain containing-hemolysin-like protein